MIKTIYGVCVPYILEYRPGPLFVNTRFLPRPLNGAGLY